MKFFIFFITLYPRIEVFPRIFEAGKITEGDRIIAEFKIKNKGDASLEIFDLKTCCGIKAFIDKLKIPPSDSSFLRIEIFLDNPGEYEQEVLLITNDPYEPRMRLKIKANVLKVPRPDIETEEIVNIGECLLGEKKDTFINVYNKGDADLILLEVEGSASCEIVSKLPITIKPGEKEILNIEIEPVKEGIFEENIRIATNIKGKIFHFIKIRGNAKAENFSPLILFKNDTLILINKTRRDIFIEKVKVKDKIFLKGRILKKDENIKINLKGIKRGDFEIDFKIPKILD